MRWQVHSESRVSLTSCIAQVSHFAISPAAVSGTSSQCETGGTALESHVPVIISSRVCHCGNQTRHLKRRGVGGWGQRQTSEWTEDSSPSLKDLKDSHMAGRTLLAEHLMEQKEVLRKRARASRREKIYIVQAEDFYFSFHFEF